jgi:hypothetical protein
MSTVPDLREVRQADEVASLYFYPIGALRNFYQPSMRDGADDWTLRSSSVIMTSRGYLDRGDLLVYGVNFVRQSRDYDRAVSQ